MCVERWVSKSTPADLFSLTCLMSFGPFGISRRMWKCHFDFDLCCALKWKFINSTPSPGWWQYYIIHFLLWICYVRSTTALGFNLELKSLWILTVQTPVCYYGSLVVSVNLIIVDALKVSAIISVLQNQTWHLMYWRYSDALSYLFSLLSCKKRSLFCHSYSAIFVYCMHWAGGACISKQVLFFVLCIQNTKYCWILFALNTF